MIYLILIFIALISYLLGFRLGLAKRQSFKLRKKNRCEVSKLQKEYENFLNYDGTIQE